MKNSIKNIALLILILAAALSLAACGGNKKKELTASQKEHVDNITKMAVSSEVFTKYGLEPGITIDEIKSYETNDHDIYRLTFETSGSYTVMESGTMYSGTFKVKGYSVAHGSGWDSVTITDAKNGTRKLPEQSIVYETEGGQTSVQTTAEPVLQSDAMIRLSKQYKNEGCNIQVLDPSEEFENCYGALEHFRAYSNDRYVEVFLYDSAEAAENAEFMMYGEGPDRLEGQAVSTKIVEGTILIAEYTK